jgi:hypothetical protein
VDQIKQKKESSNARKKGEIFLICKSKAKNRYRIFKKGIDIKKEANFIL